MTTQVTMTSTDEQALKDAVTRFDERIEIERVLSIRLYRCVELVRQTLEAITNFAGHERVSCESEENAIIVRVQDRVLTFVPAFGFAADNRLHRPRGMSCSQMLIYAHLTRQKEGRLISSFRIYPDGLCSDGDDTWRLDDEPAKLSGYLTRLVVRHLIDCDLLWPNREELPEYINTVRVTENKIESEALTQTCIGFECSRPGSDSSQPTSCNGPEE